MIITELGTYTCNEVNCSATSIVFIYFLSHSDARCLYGISVQLSVRPYNSGIDVEMVFIVCQHAHCYGKSVCPSVCLSHAGTVLK